jgi:tetratricopeptide (TPR) repeat protein
MRLLEEALEALPPHDSALRARVLGRLAVALTFADAGGRKESLSRQAVEMAERVGDLDARATVLAMRHTALSGPGNVEERLVTATEILRLADEAGEPEIALEAHRWRLTDLLELGDIAGVDREIEAYELLAGKLRQPLQVSFAATLRGMRALMTGRFSEGEALAAEALSVGPRFQSQVKIALLAQRYWLCRVRGRLQDLPTVMGDIDQAAAAMPAAQCAFAATLCDLGMVEEARALFEQVAANDFSDVPRDFAWLPAMTALVDACTFLGDGRRAATLYQLLLPHAGRNITIANATLCFGPVSYYLGRLAATMGRHAEAAAHFEQALAMSEAMGARPLVAQAKRAYAVTLLARGRAVELLNQALDTARELGMKVLAEQALADARQAQSVDAAQMGG